MKTFKPDDQVSEKSRQKDRLLLPWTDGATDCADYCDRIVGFFLVDAGVCPDRHDTGGYHHAIPDHPGHLH